MKNKKGANRFFIEDKKGFEMSFAWLFAIIAGIAILFIAIYATSQFIKTRRTEIDVQTTAKLSILLDPLETSLEEGKSSLLSFNSETRIHNDKCYTYGNFGEQSIGISVSSGVGEKWQLPSYGKPQKNKYIFSDSLEENKEFSVFSKPFKMPFKISDLIIFSGQEYCLVQSPGEIKDELESLNIKNVNFTNIKSECHENSKKICFGQSAGCDIAVYGDNYDFSSGYVSKEGENMYYVDSLVYTALFSSPEVYECNVKRLMLRLANLCLVYKDKIKILEKKDCSSLLDRDLIELSNLASSLNSSRSLLLVQEKAQEIGQINEAAECKLYEE